MKIRTGFVSNSSSSSFVIIGKTIFFNQITEENLEKSDVFVDTFHSGCDGTIGFDITKEIYEFIKTFNMENDFKYIKIIHKIKEGSNNLTIEKGIYDIIVDNYDHCSYDYFVRYIEQWSKEK